MACRYEWADDSHLIMNLLIEAPWTWEEYNHIVAQVWNMLKEYGRPCATVVDVTHMGSIPKGDIMGNLKHMEKTMPDNVFVSVLVGAPIAAVVFMNVLTRVRPRAQRKAVFAKSYEEAIKQVRQRYEQLYPESAK